MQIGIGNFENKIDLLADVSVGVANQPDGQGHTKHTDKTHKNHSFYLLHWLVITLNCLYTCSRSGFSFLRSISEFDRAGSRLSLQAGAFCSRPRHAILFVAISFIARVVIGARRLPFEQTHL